MNRRECLAILASGVVAAGVSAEVKAIDSEPEPILLVVNVDGFVSVETRRRIRADLERAFGDRPHPPIVVCCENVDITAVLDPRSQK